MTFEEEQRVRVGVGAITVVAGEWLAEHAAHNGRCWVCKSTGEEICYVDEWHDVFGVGLVRVLHLYCPECHPSFTPPDASQFTESDLVVVYPKVSENQL